jgi:hypothetical protein
MAHSHYVMDSYFPDAGGRDGFRREAHRMDDLADDAAAMAEGERIGRWKKPTFYEIRAILTSVRSGDRLIYSSRIDDTATDPEHSADEIGNPT